MNLKFAFIADSARNWFNHLLKKILICSRKLRIVCSACVLYWIFLIFERQAYKIFVIATFLKLIRSKRRMSSFLIFIKRKITTSRSYAILLYMILDLFRFSLSVLMILILCLFSEFENFLLLCSVSLWELENFLLLWHCLRDDAFENDESKKKRRMLKDDILNKDEEFWVSRNTRRREDAVCFSWCETKEKRDKRIFLIWKRIDQKKRLFLLNTRRKRNAKKEVLDNQWNIKKENDFSETRDEWKTRWDELFLSTQRKKKIWFSWEKRIEIFSQKKRKNRSKRCYQL